jgi:hypothetical protein
MDEQSNKKTRSPSVPTSLIVTVNDNPHVNILSKMTLPDWRGSITAFKGFTGTIPIQELINVDWDAVCKFLRPTRPAVFYHKKTGTYVVPCQLQVALLVGKTLYAAQKKGISTEGKMRSKGHMTEASMVMMDVDGLSETVLIACLDNLKADGISFLAYTTFSHGVADKPGMRVRLVIPLNLPVGVEGYTIVWVALDKHYFDGRISEADPSGANLYQQQGILFCHPARFDQAKSWSYEGGVASTEVLLQLGKKSQPPKHIPSKKSNVEDSQRTYASIEKKINLKQLIALVNCIDPDCIYIDWVRVGMAMFHETNGSYDGLAVYARWSSKGVKYKDFKDVENKWKSFCLGVKNPVTMGTLIKMAKDAGADVASILSSVEFDICETEVIRPSKWEVKS